MRTRINRMYTLFIVSAILLMIILCIGGLWLYVKSADAETGVLETSLTELPDENSFIIVKEAYDSFPPFEPADESIAWLSSYGLTNNENERIELLKAEYTKGRRPKTAAPALPGKGCFAIVPLDPACFGGITEYYTLPLPSMTDEQLLQLIAYGEENGMPFTADTLHAGNCKRDGGARSNRLLSAGEEDRRNRLEIRAMADGLLPEDPDLPAITLPVSGVMYIPMEPEPGGDVASFAFYPFRELTDDELLRDILYFRKQGYTYLSPAEKEDINPALDNAAMRKSLEILSGMPKSASLTSSYYRYREDTKEIRQYGKFESALISGKQTFYTVEIDCQSKKIINLRVTDFDQNFPEPLHPFEMPKVTEDIHDPKWIGMVNAAVEKTDPSGILQTEPRNFVAIGNEELPGGQYLISMADGGRYFAELRFTDGVITILMHSTDSQDPRVWYMKNQW